MIYQVWNKDKVKEFCQCSNNKELYTQDKFEYLILHTQQIS